MSSIIFTLVGLDGEVVPFTSFKIEAAAPDGVYDPEYIVPAPVIITTDAEGVATVELEATTAPYFITRLSGTIDDFIALKFFVPPSSLPIQAEMLYVDLAKHQKLHTDRALYALIETKVAMLHALNLFQLNQGLASVVSVNGQTGVVVLDAVDVGFQQSGTGAVARTAQDKMRETVSFKDFGAVGDGVADDTAAIQAAINAYKTNGKPLLVDGEFRVTAPLVYQTQGSASGLRLIGTGIYNSAIIGDFVGATLFNIDGSSLQIGRFQFGGGFSDLTLTTASGASIQNAITCNGWWFAQHSNIFIGNSSSASFTKNGIYIPLRTDLSSNPDNYASVVWTLNNVQVDSMGEYGVYGANTTGYAGWVINGGRFEGNGLDGLYVNTNGWRVQNCSASYNGRYGINFTGSSGVTLTNGAFYQIELDGNATAGVNISRVNSGIFHNLRLISRVLNGSQKQLTHVLGDYTQALTSVELKNCYHRVETGITSAVTLYDFGPATSNVAGNSVVGYRLLNSAGVSVTEQTASLLDRRYKNIVSDFSGVQKTASPSKFAWASESATAPTSTLATWIFNQAVQSTGWTDYNTTTGILTAPHNGFYHVTVNFNLTTIPAGDRVIVNIKKNGSLYRFWYDDWPSTVDADRWSFSKSELVPMLAGDTLLVEVQSTSGTPTLFGNASLCIFSI